MQRASHAPIFSCAHYFQAPAMQARSIQCTFESLENQLSEFDKSLKQFPFGNH